MQNEERNLNEQEVAKSNIVVSDTAEREIKIFDKFNSQFIKDQSQKQIILKTLPSCRKNISNAQQRYDKEIMQFKYHSIVSILLLLKTCRHFKYDKRFKPALFSFI